MTVPRPRTLVVKCTAGAEEPERCMQAFTVAATALAAGADVSLWLTGEAVWFAVPGRAEQLVLSHSAPLAELRDAVLAGGRLTVCTQCAARRDLGEDDLHRRRADRRSAHHSSTRCSPPDVAGPRLLTDDGGSRLPRCRARNSPRRRIR